MKISAADRAKLRKPLGQVMDAVEAAQIARSKKIIAVGDVCGKALIEHGVKLWIWIYDGKEMRKSVRWKIPKAHIIARNPRGNVTKSLMRAIDRALTRKGRTRIFVKGEEDLATLYCIVAAPESAVIMYGQPGMGIVAVNIKRKRALARRILRMA